jgi:hypothetical protein
MAADGSHHDEATGSKPLLTYVNFANHLDTTGGMLVSADFPATLASRLADYHGPEMLTMFANGACGNIMVHVSLHSKAYNHVKGTQCTYFKRLDGVSDTFHKYSFEWTEEYIEFFYDDRPVKRFTKGENDSLTTVEGWPFDKPFHLILNIAVGGNWGGEIDESTLPWTMEVEYVRVYQKNR